MDSLFLDYRPQKSRYTLQLKAGCMNSIYCVTTLIHLLKKCLSIRLFVAQ